MSPHEPHVAPLPLSDVDPGPDTLPGMPEPVDAPERPATYGAGETHESAPLFTAPRTIRGQLPMDTDALAFDEGAEGENAAHELGECDPADCPHCGTIGTLGAWRNEA